MGKAFAFWWNLRFGGRDNVAHDDQTDESMVLILMIAVGKELAASLWRLEGWIGISETQGEGK